MAKDNTKVEVAGFESLFPADPGPLGLNCFALTTFLLSMHNAGIIGADAAHAWLTSALILGGFAQILAGMWEYKTQNVFGATAFVSYGSFWVSLALIIIFYNKGIISPEENMIVAWFLVAWTIFTFYMWIGSIKTNKALLITFTLLLATFILLDIGHFGRPAFNVLGGYVGVATALCAWYTSAAGIINTTFGKTVLPIGPAKK